MKRSWPPLANSIGTARTIKGNSAGAWYEPIFVRDLATQQPILPFFLPRDYMRTPVEGFSGIPRPIRKPNWRGAFDA